VRTSTYSLSKALAEVLSSGSPSGLEAEHHFAEMRARAETPALSFLTGTRAGGRVLHVPLGAFGRRDVGVGGIGGGASLVGQRLERVSDLLTWSSCGQAGAQLLTGLKENVGLARTSRLPEPAWVPEVGFSPATDPQYSFTQLGPPRRISGATIVSRQLLLQAGEGTDRFIADDLARALSNQLDRIALYGPDGLADAPTGILGTAGINRVPFDWTAPNWSDFVEMRRLVETQDVGLDSFAFIVSPDSRAVLDSVTRWPGGVAGDRSMWECLEGAISTMSVKDDTIFFGQFAQMTVGIFSNATDIVINPYRLAPSGQVEIVASLYCSVAIRLAGAFGVGQEQTPPPRGPARVEPPQSQGYSEQPPAGLSAQQQPVSIAEAQERAKERKVKGAFR
jgi:hypothetical protein